MRDDNPNPVGWTGQEYDHGYQDFRNRGRSAP